jgi:hypothetical protein
MLSTSSKPSAVPLAISLHAPSQSDLPSAIPSFSQPQPSPPSSKPSQTSICRLSASVGSVISRTFLDLNPLTPSLPPLCHHPNLLRLRHRIFSSQVPLRSFSANLLRRHPSTCSLHVCPHRRHQSTLIHLQRKPTMG